MQWLNGISLVTLALLFGGGNVVVTAWRSTIPMTINGVVDSIEVRAEKHRGKDDVFLLHLQDGQTFQVDRAVGTRLRSGDLVRKERWETQLHFSSSDLELDWSLDFRGMVAAMPLILVIIAVTWVVAVTRQPAATPRPS